jgi:hypothetical protein
MTNRITRHGLSFCRVVLFTLATLPLCGGCQTLFPSTLPGGLALTEDARIAKQARAESFPSPADVGLTPATQTR